MSPEQNSPISLFNLTRLHKSIEEDILPAMSAVIDASSFVGGSSVSTFEADFARYQRVAHASGCASGTDALSLALRALKVGPGDEVIVPSMTFVASAEAVVHVGATPVIVDVDPDDLLLSAGAVKAALTENTAAIMPVHLYGNCVAAETISSWRSQGLKVVEDAAQAHGASYPDQPDLRAGGAGDAACFSFYPGKNLGAYGDGGAVVTNDSAVAETVTVLRNHGRRNKFDHELVGFCSRLDSLQAAILGAKLLHLEQWNTLRMAVATHYDEILADFSSLVPLQNRSGSVFHQYVVRVAGDRDSFKLHMAKHGISIGVHYPRAVSQYSAYTSFSHPCPVAEASATVIASLPMDPLLTPNELGRITDALVDWERDTPGSGAS